MGIPRRIKFTMDDSVREGAFSSVGEYAGKMFVLPFAVSLDAPLAVLSAVVSLPPLIMGIGGEIALNAQRLFSSRADALFKTAAAQAVAWLLLSATAYSATSLLTSEQVILGLLILASGIYLIDSFASALWFSLMADIIPCEKRALWLGRRNQVMFLAGLMALAISGLGLNWFSSNNIFLGFSMIFLLAALSRFRSALILRRHYEPPAPLEAAPKGKRNVLFKEFLAFTFLLNFVVYFAAPFLSIHVLRNLGFDYFSYSLMMGVQILFAVLSYSNWGMVIKKYGSRQVFIAAGFLSSALPITWMYIQTPLHALLAEAAAGTLWSGINLATYAYLLEISQGRAKLEQYAHRNLAFNGGIFLGTLAGGAALSYMTGGGADALDAFKALFILSSIGRLALFIIADGRIARTAPPEKEIDTRSLLIRIVTVYPIKGLIHDVHDLVDFAREEARTSAKLIQNLRWAAHEFSLLVFYPINIGHEVAEEAWGEMLPVVRYGRRVLRDDMALAARELRRISSLLSLGLPRAINPRKRAEKRDKGPNAPGN